VDPAGKTKAADGRGTFVGCPANATVTKQTATANTAPKTFMFAPREVAPRHDSNIRLGSGRQAWGKLRGLPAGSLLAGWTPQGLAEACEASAFNVWTTSFRRD
jgi:hypothetical protein